MNLEKLSLEDVIYLRQHFGYEVVVSDGGILGFEKVEICGNRRMYFSFSNKRKHSACK